MFQKIKFIPTKIPKTVATRAAPFGLDMHQIVCRLGLCPTAHWGSLQRSLRPPSWFSGWGPRGKGRREGRGIGRRGGEGGKGRGREGTYVNITSCFCFMRLCNKIMNVIWYCIILVVCISSLKRGGTGIIYIGIGYIIQRPDGYPGTRFITRSGTRVKKYPEIRALVSGHHKEQAG